MEKILSNKQTREKIYQSGFVYYLNRSHANYRYYNCERYYTSNCRGRLKIKNGEEIGEETQTHSHLPDARSVCKAKVLDCLKGLDKIEKRNARDLVVEACASVDEPTVAALPSIKNLNRLATRIQNKDGICANPKTLIDLVFDENIVTTHDNQNFLLYDSASDENIGSNERIVIFGTRKNVQILKSCEIIAMDGTFKMVPLLFKQLFTVHGSIKFSKNFFFYIFEDF